MGRYDKITDMLEEEIEKIEMSGKLSTSALDVGDKAAHFLKSIKTIEAMDDAGASGRYYDYDSNSYARGRGRYARRDSMGRYADNMPSGNYHEMMNELNSLKRRVEQMEG